MKNTSYVGSRSAGNGIFCAALFVLAAFFFACETGSDPDDTLPLAGPRSIQVTARNESLVLQWTKVAPAQGIIPSYEVYYGTAANTGSAAKWGDVESNTSNLVSETITELTNHQTYYVWVKAVYGELGRSDFSPVTYGIPIPPPATPGTLTVVAGEAMLEVTWTAVADAFTYEAYYQSGGSGDTPPAETAETMLAVSEAGAVIHGLNNSTNYRVWVRARNTAGDSPGYSTDTGTPAVAGSKPASPPGEVTVMPGDGKLTLTWNQVAGVPAYRLYYGKTDNFSEAAEFGLPVPASAPRVSADIMGLANDTLYYVWVKSSNSQGVSDSYSPAVSGKPLAKAPINFSNLQFNLGEAAAEYIFAQDLPPSVFFPEGRPNTDRLTRVQETALGNLFTDAAAWYIRKKYPDENIDFVFLNGGYIDNGLSKGTVTVGGISAIVQPDSRRDKFMLLTLTGAELKKFFNDTEGKKTNIEPGDVSGVAHSGRGGPHNTGFFGVVSKEARYTLRYYKPPEGTNELSSEEREPYYHGFIDTGSDLKINGAAINDSASYRICTTDYLAAGEYFVLLYTAGKNKKVIDTPFWHGVVEYIYDQGIVTPKLDGRIKIEGGVPLPAPWIPGSLAKP